MTQVSPVVPVFQHYQQQQDRLEQEAKRIAQENQEDAAKQQAARDAARADRNSQMWRQCQDDIKAIEQAICQLKQENPQFAALSVAFHETSFVSLLDVRLVEETSGQGQASAGTRTLRRISLDFYQDTQGNIRLQPFDNKRGQVRFNSQTWPDVLQEEFIDQVNWLATDPAHLGRTLFGLTNSPDKPHRREIVAIEQS